MNLMRLYPAFRLPQDYVAVMQPDGGFVEAEAGIRAHLQLAVAAGADIRTGERVLAIEDAGHCVRVRTERQDAGSQSRAIVTAGAWTTSLLPGTCRCRFRSRARCCSGCGRHSRNCSGPGWFPVFMIESEHGIHYGLPLHDDDLLKIAKHHHAGEIVDPETYDRAVTEADEASVFNRPLFRDAAGRPGPVVSPRTCLYTMAPDGDFVIDRVPGTSVSSSPRPAPATASNLRPRSARRWSELAFSGRTGLDLPLQAVADRPLHAATVRTLATCGRPVTSPFEARAASRRRSC